MKKLILAMIVGSITTLTSCTNDSNEVAPIQQQKAINKTMSKSDATEGELSESEIKALTELDAEPSNDAASLTAIRAVENLVNGTTSESKDSISSTVVCHGNYSDSISWSYVQVTINGTLYHRLVRRYRTGSGTILTTVQRITYSYAPCDSTLFM